MNALAQISFQTSYRQLRPAEKLFVDQFISNAETGAARENVKLRHYIERPQVPHEMLQRPLVLAAIAERVSEITAASELTAFRVLKELQAIAFSNLGHYMELGEDGMPYFDFARCTPEQLGAISSIKFEQTPHGNRKLELKLHDKLAGLDKLMRYMGLLEPDNPYWRQDQAKPVNAPVIPATASAEDAHNEYARMING